MGKAKLQVTVLGLSLVALLLLGTVVQDADASMHFAVLGPDDLEVRKDKDLVRPGPGEIANDMSTPAGGTP
jgi:NhaP-type Na+/H+ and K+/H+ antiporter